MICGAIKRFPRELESYTPQAVHLHQGIQMNIDVLRRASKFIMINCDWFSSFSTATLITSKTKADLAEAILTVFTPIRHEASVEVRTHRALALQSLANKPEQQLVERLPWEPQFQLLDQQGHRGAGGGAQEAEPSRSQAGHRHYQPGSH